MTDTILNDELTTFRLMRGNGRNGLGPELDPLVKAHLKELDEKLSRKVFEGRHDAAANARARARMPVGASSQAAANVKEILREREQFGAKFTPPLGDEADPQYWGDDTVVQFFATSDEAEFNLTELIDQSPGLAKLKYSFLDSLQKGWGRVPYNARAVLRGHKAITDYLIVHAVLVKGVEDTDAVYNFILNQSEGVRQIVLYAALSAARQLIDRDQLKVPGYNDDGSEFARRFIDLPVVLSAITFTKQVKGLIKEFQFDLDEEGIINGVIANGHLGKLPDGVKPLLIKYMQNSPITITPENADYYLPHFVLQILRMRGAADPASVESAAVPDTDFRVRFQDEDDDAGIEISSPAVQCAAQLYHAMVLGDELDVLGAVNYLTNKRLLMNGGLHIKSQTLRKDLKDYVFNNQFTDLETGTVMERTRQAERHMFYRQVFDEGRARSPDDMPINGEFPQLWKVLMLETARYLERAQDSPHPESYVSGQNVMQAVEDLQYNLSTTCTGMATVMAPLVDAEINFVLERILKHPEVLQHVVPEGGTWKRVVDRLNMERRKHPGNASTVYNKARFGKNIIDAIALYRVGDFDDQAKLSAFISLVDAFITTQSILQRRRFGIPKEDTDTDDLREQPMPALAAPKEPQPREPQKAAAGGDDWDF